MTCFFASSNIYIYLSSSGVWKPFNVVTIEGTVPFIKTGIPNWQCIHPFNGVHLL